MCVALCSQHVSLMFVNGYNFHTERNILFQSLEKQEVNERTQTTELITSFTQYFCTVMNLFYASNHRAVKDYVGNENYESM